MTERFFISRREAARLIRLAEASAPSEAFGVLGAVSTAGGMRLRLYPMANAAGSPIGFRVSMRQMKAGRAVLLREGLLLAGCFHTHPSADPTPSGLDRASMLRFPLWWLIYSPRTRRAVIVRVRAGLLEEGQLRVVS